jgi:glucose-6-phosphate dehydrogenase assembly protein OpcA
MTPAPPAAPAEAAVPLDGVERELDHQLKLLQCPGEGPLTRVRMSNLVIYCNTPDQGAAIATQVPEVAAVHPARVLLLIGQPEAQDGPIQASVLVRTRPLEGGHRACSEQVTLRAAGGAIDRLPFAVRSLLIGDLPTNLWWAANQPPPLAGPLLYELVELSQQIVYDSLGWTDPARGVAATATWLEQIQRASAGGRWRVASDLNWRRLKYWRRLLAQALDPASTPGAVESLSEVQLEHGPHAVVQAWELASWLCQRLGWRIVTGKVQRGVELAWRLTGAHGDLQLRIRRLEQGPPEIRKVRLACVLQGKPGALSLTVQDDRRLAIQLEGVEAATRTMTVPPQSPAELVGRQLSDREPDPVFLESMAVARLLAQSVLG